MRRQILSAKEMNNRISEVVYECWGEIMSRFNNKLMKNSKNLVSKINSNINLKDKFYEVDIPTFYFLVALK